MQAGLPACGNRLGQDTLVHTSVVLNLAAVWRLWILVHCRNAYWGADCAYLSSLESDFPLDIKSKRLDPRRKQLLAQKIHLDSSMSVSALPGLKQ